LASEVFEFVWLTRGAAGAYGSDFPKSTWLISVWTTVSMIVEPTVGADREDRLAATEGR
jgi:hypothetical protein